MAEQQENLRMYLGRFTFKVDPHRRVPVPAAWKSKDWDSDFAFTLVLLPSHLAGTCIRVLPPEGLARLRGMISGLPETDPSKGILFRAIAGDSYQVKPDGVGRLTLPDDFCAAAGITTEATLGGMFESFEIWQPGKYLMAREIDGKLDPAAYKKVGL